MAEGEGWRVLLSKQRIQEEEWSLPGVGGNLVGRHSRYMLGFKRDYLGSYV